MPVCWLWASVTVCACCLYVCGEGGWWGYFYSCYILWQWCDSTFRSVQTMWLTQHCSPQPQCKSHFLKPVPWHMRILRITSLLIKNQTLLTALAARSTCMHSPACSFWMLHCSHFRHKKHVNMARSSSKVTLYTVETPRRKLGEASTYLQHTVSVYNAQRTVRKGGIEVFWIMNGQHCTTDSLLFGVVQSSGILLILRKRLAGSFPVYWTNPL